MAHIRMARISVLMPVFNASKYLVKAIHSIRTQSFADFEFIVINDGSTDSSLSILEGEAQQDARIRVLSRRNTGIVQALNDGLAVATGEFVARMDADDLSYATRFDRQVSYLKNHPELVAAGCDVRMIDPAGGPLKRFNVCTEPEVLRRRIIAIQDIGIIHPTLMVRREILNQVGGYRLQYDLVEDFDLFFRLLDVGDLGNVREVLLDYRQHLASTNSLRQHRQRELMMRCIEEHRARWNLPLLESPLPEAQSAIPGAHSIQWAYWAMEGGYRRTALRYAVISCLRSRFSRGSLKCLHYVARTCLFS